MSLESIMNHVIGSLPENHQVPDGRIEQETVRFDCSELTDTKWKALAAEYLKAAETFEIHCWNEETEWIKLALRYGELKKTNWQLGKVIAGPVTPEFTEMLLSLPKPNDTDIYNKMTPFFGVFLDSHFDSSHYGTEIYLNEPGKKG